MADLGRLFEGALAGLERRVPLSTLVDYRGDIVLMYHAVGRGWKTPHSLPLATFKRQVETLANEHRVVHLRELASEPDAESPRVAITFDDGYRDFHDIVVPILQDNDVPATVFISPEFLGDANPDLACDRYGVLADVPDGERAFMTQSELKAVASTDLVNVGNHTLTHPDLSKLAHTDLEWEIEGGRETLEDILGRSVDLFSYPYGSYAAETFERIRSVVDQSHQLAVTSKRGHVTAATDRLLLERVEAPAERELFGFRVSPLYGHLIALYRRLE